MPKNNFIEVDQIYEIKVGHVYSIAGMKSDPFEHFFVFGARTQDWGGECQVDYINLTTGEVVKNYRLGPFTAQMNWEAVSYDK